MLRVLLLATLAVAPTTAIAPIDVKFTSDSVYKYESIIIPKEIIAEETEGLYTLVLEEDKLLGYAIYDNAETEYIDGLKFDDSFVTNWTVEHVDFSKEHTILVKTVYTEDIAGMLAAAKDGDWSKALSNPLILFQLFYYILAAISLIVGGVGLLKSRKRKVKTSEEIAAAVDKHSAASTEELKSVAESIIKSIVMTAIGNVTNQNQKLTEALILSQSKDSDSKLALIKLLKESSNVNLDDISKQITKSIEEEMSKKEQAKKEAISVLNNLSNKVDKVEDKIEDSLGGISI